MVFGILLSSKREENTLFLKQALPSFQGPGSDLNRTDIRSRTGSRHTPLPAPNPSKISGLDPQRHGTPLLEEARGPPSAR